MATRPKTPDIDPMKMFADMKLPNVPDVETLLGTYRRNIEVFSQANRIALEGAQTVARRHMEILQQMVSELAETVKVMSEADAPAAKAAKQAEMLKHSYERSIANSKELSDLIQHANAEALGLLNRRFMEAMDEVKSLMEKAGK